MKKLIFILALSLVFAGCKKDEPKPPFKLDPNATILLRPAKGVPLKVKSLTTAADAVHLTALEIVKQTNDMYYHNDKTALGQTIKRGFADVQRDFDKPALKMWGIDIIDEDGNLKPNFIESYDILLVTSKIDTIAYIPNSVLRTAETAIKAAYNAKNTEEVYRLFNEAFTFTPITGAEWRVLKSQGKQ